MPFPNEHAARLTAPGKYIRFRRHADKFDPGVDGMYGVPEDGEAELHSLRFDEAKFTPEEARAWLQKHGHATLAFEAAEKKEDGLTPGAFIAEDEVLRFDRISLPGKIQRTDEGFIEADPVVTRTGVFKYCMPDGVIRRELRCDEEVFAEDSLRSARMIPITNDHPKTFVRPKNAKALAVGWTGENVRRDGTNVRAPIKITTEEGIKAVEGGRKQLSLGYKCAVERKDGELNGEKYTHIQRRIRYNHLALCDVARAGAQATLRLDSVDAVMVSEEERKETRTMPGKMVKLDSGIAYECPPEVEAAYNVKTKELTETTEKRDALQTELDTLKGKHDGLKKEKEELEKKDSGKEIAEAAKVRVGLLGTVAKMVSEEEAKKLDSMTDDELRIAAIKATDKDFDPEGKSADYLQARFDGASTTFNKAGSSKSKQGKTVVGSGTHRQDEDEGDPDKARDTMIRRQDGIKDKDEDKAK